MVEEKDFWVIFDGYGNEVFNTYQEEYANFNNMNISEYNHSKCTIVKNPVVDGELITKLDGLNQLTNIGGILQKITLPRGTIRVSPHIPAL